MASYRQHYYHIVFGTKRRERTIPNEHCILLYKYIWGFIEKKKCKLYCIDGCEDHIHLLVDIHPRIAIADFVKDLKVSTSLWLKEKQEFKNFKGWSEGYASFTVSHNSKNAIVEYIKSQKEHHKHISFQEEYIAILQENGLEFEENELE